ncbi:MAG: phospholipid/cholesterol/gamma-HCH transport system ATP-binding protein, partial [Solirubrobacteraceae bacterium]|nr:phospholipid/cholesterol/gamma-HCH transport system ATP-binding protein [Solirubrobacteraceae bacterium]
MADSSPDHSEDGPREGGVGADNDPRNIGDQSEENSASARGAEVEMSPEEREQNIKSAAPDGGEIKDTPSMEEARHDEGPSESEAQDGGQDDRGKGGSRVSVTSESPPRPGPPDGVSDDEYKWHTYKVYPSGRPDAVEFIDTYKSFGRTHILRGLNMGLPEGMVSMILGPSGTGKSVCIKHMVGLLYPDQGDILVHGESVPNMPDDDLFDMRKKFGLLFQDGALFGSMNLYDNVAFPLRQHTEKGE